MLSDQQHLLKMALLANPDIVYKIRQLLAPKEFILFGAICQHTRSITLPCPIYQELCRLKFDKDLYRFDSYEIIASYYTHGTVNLIAHYSYDHYRGAYLAAMHGHLDLVELIDRSTSLPLAQYNLRTDTVIIAQIAVTNKHIHILKWFADRGVIDDRFLPRKINETKIDLMDVKIIVEYALSIGDLALLKELIKINYNSSFFWSMIVSKACEYGHIDILKWITNLVLGHHCDRNCRFDIDIILPYDTDSEKKKIMTMLKWYLTHREKFPCKLDLNLCHVFKLGQIDILEQLCNQINLTTETILCAIISAGNLDTIQWYFDKKAYRLFFRKHISNGNVIRWAIIAQHLAVLKWVASVTRSLLYREDNIGYIIATGDINMLEWVLTVKWVEVIEWQTDKEVEARIINTDALQSAAHHGYIHVLVWLRQNQFLPANQNKWIVYGAIEGGQIHVLKWLGKDAISLACEEIVDLVGRVIKYGRVDILALFNEYQFIDQTKLYQITNFASQSMYQFDSDGYPVLLWLREHGYYFHNDAILWWAIRHDAWHVVEWLMKECFDHDKLTANLNKVPDDLRLKLNQYQEFRMHLFKI